MYGTWVDTQLGTLILGSNSLWESSEQ